MKPHLDVITLAVRDLERAVAFYRDGLGLPTKGIVATEFEATAENAAGAAAFFEMESGLLLALYPRTELAKGIGERATRDRSLRWYVRRLYRQFQHARADPGASGCAPVVSTPLSRARRRPLRPPQPVGR